MSREIFIRFLAQVNEQTTQRLFTIIDDLISHDIEKIHLMMSTPGGSVHHGLSLYNYLVSIPVELHTYNFGSVDSIGVILYCTGKKRHSVTHARFLLHPIHSSISANSSMDEKAVDELLKSLKIDQENISKIISATIQAKKSPKEVETLMHSRTTWNSEEAKENGLVHEVTPLNAPLRNVMPIFNEPHLSQNVPLVFSSNKDNFSTIDKNYSKPNNNFSQIYF